MRRFFIEAVGADVADVGVGKADDLTGVTRVGENFLIAGERGIENDFAAAARARAGGTALKYAPVLERENGFCRWQVQSYVLRKSFFRASRVSDGFGNHPEAIEGPVGKHSLAVDGFAGHGTEDARVVGTGTVIAHNEKLLIRNGVGPE